MAISPPSDLVLDVLRAADPASVQAARARLASGTPAPAAAAGETFSAEFNRAGHTMAAARPAGAPKEAPEAYRKFEAMVLQSFIQSMLPKDSEDVYGKGTAGNVWKSMMARQIADVISKRGGIGIADHLLEGRFSGLGATEAPRPGATGDNLNLAAGLVQQLQMNAFETALPTTRNDDNDGTA